MAQQDLWHVEATGGFSAEIGGFRMVVQALKGTGREVRSPGFASGRRTDAHGLGHRRRLARRNGRGRANGRQMFQIRPASNDLAMSPCNLPPRNSP